MNKFTRALALILSLCTLSVLPAAAAGADDDGAMRGVWVSSVYNLDYPSVQTTDAAALRREADDILDNCAQWGINTVFLQVRPTSDALYDSDIFPWSRYLTGSQGTAPEDGLDPLEYWIDEAHDRGIELHAWINPYRITRAGATDWDDVSPDNPAAEHPEWVIEYGGNYYYDPGLPAVREMVIEGAVEIARNYDVDGIHLDDYFYPGTDFNDDATYARYGGGLSLADWRRDNVNQLVEGLHDALAKYDVTFGISPSGIWANQSTDPRGSATAGSEHYVKSYADSLCWIENGWIDYIVPQIYWEIGHQLADFATLADWWQNAVKGSDVKLYIGMPAYRCTDATSGVWTTSDPLFQNLDYLAQNNLSEGYVYFRYGSLRDVPGLSSRLTAWYGTDHPAVVPPHGDGDAAGASGLTRTFGDIFNKLLLSMIR